MIQTDLYNALRLLRGDLPDVQNGQEAWEAVRPEHGSVFVKGSFWDVLQKHLLFSRSVHRQSRIANWIHGQKERAGVWPPIPLVTKQAVLPLPNTLK